MRWIILSAVIVLFAMSVTIKYQPVRAYYTSYDRYNHVLHERPAYPLVVYCNTRLPADAVIYQSWYDEYRSWFMRPVIGRREWRTSWEDYRATYPENKAKYLYEWLDGMGVTHLMVHPYGPFELPLWDEEFNDYFKKQTEYGPHTLYRLDTSDVGMVGQTDLGFPSRPDTPVSLPNSWLQE